jgi:hypothetical protein
MPRRKIIDKIPPQNKLNSSLSSILKNSDKLQEHLDHKNDINVQETENKINDLSIDQAKQTSKEDQAKQPSKEDQAKQTSLEVQEKQTFVEDQNQAKQTFEEDQAKQTFEEVQAKQTSIEVQAKQTSIEVQAKQTSIEVQEKQTENSNNKLKSKNKQDKNEKTDTKVDTNLKKRGRKPKDTLPLNVNHDKVELESDNIIIHLPIKTEKPKPTDFPSNDTTPQYNAIMNEPKPYNIASDNDAALLLSAEKEFEIINQLNDMNDNLTGYNNSDVINEFNKLNKNILQADNIDMDDFNKNLNMNMNNIEINHNQSNLNITNNINEKICHIHNWGTEPIKNFNEVLEKLKLIRQLDNDSINQHTSRKNVEKCLVQMDEMNKTSSWPSSTNIKCWWCRHNFKGVPCALPVYYVNEIFYVFGIFCSPECAAAYNFSDFLNIGDKWERYSLLNFLYRRLYGDNNIRIKLAPPWQTLQDCGGQLSIQEFRQQNLDPDNSVKIILPPMTSLIPVQEISTIEKGYHTKHNNNIRMANGISSINDDTYSVDTISTVNTNLYGNENTADLRLRRTKPLKSSNSGLNIIIK